MSQVMQPSPGAINCGETSEDILKGTNSSQTPAAGSNGFNIPSITWARWVLASIVFLAAPIYKKALRIEGGVEKVAEVVVEATEKVAEIADKVAEDVADALPDGELKEEVLDFEKHAVFVEKDAEMFEEFIRKDAEMFEEFIRKVNHMKEEIEANVEPIIEEAELIEKEDEEMHK